MVVMPLVIFAGCVLNPVDNPTLDGTTWEITSTVGGLSPSLLLDYVAINEKVIVTFGSGFGTTQAVANGETRDLDTFSFTLTGTTLEVTRGSPLVIEQEYELVRNDRRMRWNSVVGGFAYYKFKPHE
jgi:hypothetical protein